MILVVGSTGMVGGEVCRLLAADGQPVHALVRATSDAGKVQHLHDIGIPTVVGDLRDKASLAAAMQDVTAVISTASAMPFSYVPGVNDVEAVDHQGLLNLIDAAKEARVQKVIIISLSDNLKIDFPLLAAKRDVERHLMASGMHYTILRPSCFMEVWLTSAVGFDVANAQAQIYGSGQEPVSYISFKDVAKFAVECLHNPMATDKILELGGPDLVSQLDAVKIFEKTGGREFVLTHVPTEVLQKQREEATDPMQKSFAALMLCVANGDPIDMSQTQKDFPIPLLSVREYAAQLAPQMAMA